MLAALLLACDSAAAENWPAWRGPRADGSSLETGVPLRWGRQENIVWKTKLTGLGMSTPIVWGDRIFLTSQIGRGIVEARSAKEVGVPENDGAPVTLLIQCYSASNGKLLWERRLEPVLPLPVVHPYHNLSTPSCVTDGERVYAWFGTGQILCLTLDGAVQWQRNIAAEHSPFSLSWGHASSPVLHGRLLYLQCDHEPVAYLLALEKETGKTVWKRDRGRDLRSYSTPLVIPVGNRFELLLNSSPRLDAFDAETGAPLWHADEFACRAPVPSPVLSGGVVYTSRGFNSGPYMALRPGGRGDVTGRMLWRVPTGAPYVSSPLVYRGLLYLAAETGVVRCVDPATGASVWVERMGGAFSASPIGAEGRVYLLNDAGKTLVLEAGARKPVILTRNDLGEPCKASPAVAHGRIYIRTDSHLYCIGSPSGHP
jgi:outer membrane protein assembly factor BamB